MLVLMVVSGRPPTWRLVGLPAAGLLTLLIAFAVGSALAALNVMYRDIRYVMPFLTQFWMFASPVIYPASLVPSRWRWLLYLNPMTGAIEGFRTTLLGTPFDWVATTCSVFVALAMAWAGVAYFRRIEDRLADLI